MQQNVPFASKELPTGEKLYKREHGKQFTLTTGYNDLLFTIPHNWVKMTAIEIVGGESLDYTDLYILDTTTGAYFGTPNATLNQFGYSVNIVADHYEEESAYDADLYLGMQIKLRYYSQSAKTIGINFNLSEVK